MSLSVFPDKNDVPDNQKRGRGFAGVKKIMIRFVAILILILLLLCCFVIVKRIMWNNTYKIRTENGIQESTYIDVNGIKQYIQIRGEDKDNDVVIFLHGGPANPISYLSPYFQKNLEDVVTFVQYDQRGSGRTYYKNNCDSDTNVDLLLADLDGIVDYVCERFGKEKVIIMGHSWGTALGTLYVHEHPEKVSSYIALSQATNVHDNKASAANQALQTAAIKNTEDEKTLQLLLDKWNQVKSYDEISLADLSEMTKLAGKYIGCDGEVSGMELFKIGLFSGDMSINDMRWFLESSDSTKYLTYNRDVMEYFLFQYDIENLPNTYEMPVYYVAGEGDYILPQKEAKEYFEKIEAPKKEFLLLENVGHDIFLDDPKLFENTIRTILAD